MASKSKKSATSHTPIKADEKLRVGIIGGGGISHQHMKFLTRWTDEVEVVAVADVMPKNLERYQKDYAMPAEMCFSTWQDMLKKANLHAVSICTPNSLHYQPTMDALKAGCHVLVEKPLAMNAREGQKMVDLANKLGLSLTIAFQHRFEPGTQLIRKAYTDGALGEIMYAKVHALRRRGIPNWGVFGQKNLQGGGPMIDIGVHAMEMTHYAMGLPKPISASGNIWTYLGDKPSDIASNWAGWDHKTYTVEDLAVGQIRFDNGAIMTVEAMFAGHIPLDMQGMKFELIGTKGGARKDPLSLHYDAHGHMVDVTPAWTGDNKMWDVKMRNWVDVCKYGKENQSPGEHGLMIQKMIDAIYKSAETGKEVKIT